MQAEIAVGILATSAALGGVVISQAFAMLQSHLDYKRQRKLLLQQKLEELTQHLNASLIWASESVDALSSHRPTPARDPVDARQMYSLCLLFFSPLKPHATGYLDACLELLTSINKTIRGEIADATDASKALGKARAALDSAIESFAQENISK